MDPTSFWPVVQNGRPAISEARFGSVAEACFAADTFLISVFNTADYTDFTIHEHAGIYGPLYEVVFTKVLAA